MQVFFRPEEVHAVSTVGPFFMGASETVIGDSDNPLRFMLNQISVIDLQHYPFTTIETRRFDPYRNSREKPADR